MRLVPFLLLAACSAPTPVAFWVEVSNDGPRAFFELSGDVDGRPIVGSQYVDASGSITSKRDAFVGQTVGLGITFTGNPNGTRHDVAAAQVVPGAGLLIRVHRDAVGAVAFEYGSP